jgi:hypothetical protein
MIKMLVVTPGRLGDFVMAVPALRMLKKTVEAEAEVTLVVGPEAGDLAVRLPYSDKIVIGTRDGKVLQFGQLVESSYDVGVLLRYDADYYGVAGQMQKCCDFTATWASNVTEAKLKRNGPAWDRNFDMVLRPDGHIMHEVLRNLVLAGSVGGFNVSTTEPLALPYLREFAKLPELPLVVAPFTGEAHKDMLTDWWPLLKGREAVLIGTPEQAAKLEAMAEEIEASVYTGPLTTSMGLVANAGKVVTMDSGMSHVAAAYGRPHMAIFTGWDGTDGSSYDPKRFGPWASTSRWTRQQDQLIDFLEA